MKIQNKEIDMASHYLSPVTYVPNHVEGNAGHDDCEQGVIVDINDEFVKVLYCKGRTVQSTSPEDLVWG